jgi:hypothetical protein
VDLKGDTMKDKKYKNLAKEVVANSILIEKKMPWLLKQAKYKNQYIVLNKGEFYITMSFSGAVEKGLLQFGKSVGFAVEKITDEIPILSKFVVKP